MAVPKKRCSVSRKGLRRAGQHHKLYAKTISFCSNCQGPVLPLYVCPSCGQYKGKEIIAMPVAEDETQEESSSEA